MSRRIGDVTTSARPMKKRRTITARDENEFHPDQDGAMPGTTRGPGHSGDGSGMVIARNNVCGEEFEVKEFLGPAVIPGA